MHYRCSIFFVFFFSTGFSKSWSFCRRSETWHPIWLGGWPGGHGGTPRIYQWIVDDVYCLLQRLSNCTHENPIFGEVFCGLDRQALGKFLFLDRQASFGFFFWCILAWEPPTVRGGSQPKMRFIIGWSPASGAASRIGDHMPGVLLCTKGEVRCQGAEQQFFTKRCSHWCCGGGCINYSTAICMRKFDFFVHPVG